MYKEVPLQGVSIFALKESYKLAQLLGKEKEVADLPQLTDKMIKAARKNLYNRKTGFFRTIFMSVRHNLCVISL